MSAIMMLRFAVTLLVLIGLAPAPALAVKFLPDDPLVEDDDRLPIPKPAEVELSQGYDFMANTFFEPGHDQRTPARNTNTLGEVPDSAWFTNRIGHRPMGIDELVRGPNQGTGPDTTGPWTITRSKTQGVTPGFTIADPRGNVYFIKFDPRDNPQLSTSTEVIVTKFFYALGYSVPENYLAYIRPEQLAISPKAKITDEDGKKRPMQKEDVDRTFRRVPRRPDGSVQVVASLGLPGQPLGPFLYSGTRSDDPNDIFPHEMRRELRGLRVFAAWLNHDDSRSINSLDMFVPEGDRGWVKHYLLDFGSCLGSGSTRPQNPRAGNEYIYETKPMIKSALTLGLWDRPWRKVKYPDYPSLGRFEADFFRPELWRPEYPNPAFDQMDDADALWATRIVMCFSDDAIRALVRTGSIDDPKAEDYLIRTLIQRRDKTIAHYLQQLTPLTDFALASPGAASSGAPAAGDPAPAGSSGLQFRNLGVEAGLAAGATYRYQWFRFDNDRDSAEPLGPGASAASAAIPVPRDGAAFLMARIELTDPPFVGWKRKVDVYLRNGSTLAVVGIERE